MELPEKQRMRWSTLVFLLLISVIGGLFIWNRPVKPLWVDNAGKGGSSFVGVSSDGHLAFLDSKNRLTVRNIKTGAILRTFNTPSINGFWGFATQDGKWVVLVSTVPELVVISLEDGSFRYPPIPIQRVGYPILRDDGRYAIIIGAVDSAPGMDTLIDLSQGQVLWRSKSHLRFCGNHQDLVIASEPPEFLAHRLITISDQRDLGSIAFPEMKGRKLAGIVPCPDDRILLCYKIPMDGDDSGIKCFSARLSGTELVDVREEPWFYYRQEDGQYVEAKLHGKLMRRDLNQTSSGRGLMQFYEFASSLGLVRDWRPEQYSWQATASGRPVGPPISLQNVAHPTKDGQYLVEAGPRLAVFPISRRSRWPETLVVAALPWLLVAAWKRFRSGREGRKGQNA